MRRTLLVLVLIVAPVALGLGVLSAWRRQNRRPPRTPKPVAHALVWIRDDGRPGGPGTALLSGVDLASASGTWTHDPSLRRWSATVRDAAAWAARWPGPGVAAASPDGRLTVDLPAPDPDFPLRAVTLTLPDGGRWKPGGRAPEDVRIFATRSSSDLPLHVSSRDDSPSAEQDFERRLVARIDFIPSDRASTFRNRPEFQARDLAETWVLWIDLPDPSRRAAIAAAVDPAAACRRGLFDATRAARRLAPDALGLPDLPPAGRTPPIPSKPFRVTLDTDLGRDALLLAPAVRGALRERGFEVLAPAAGELPDLTLLRLSAASPVPADFFAPLRESLESHASLVPILDAIDSASSPEERASWYAALEGAIMDRGLAIPLARGVCYSLASPDVPVEVDVFGRYRPVAAPRATR